MKKYILSTFQFLLSLTLVTTSIAPSYAAGPGAVDMTPEAQSTPPAQLEIDSSYRIFRKYIDNPLIGEAFRKIQVQLLNLTSDSNLTNFLINGSPVLNKLYQNLKAEHDMQLEGFSLMARSSMVKIKPGYDPLYDNLLKTITKSALKKGFSENAVNKLELFVMPGDLNAFTVSGNDNRIIVVVQSKLLEKLTEAEVQRVIDHELGHILSSHSLKNQMFSYIMNAMALSLVRNGLSPEAFAAQTKNTFDQIDFSNLQNRNLIATDMKNSTVINYLIDKYAISKKRSNASGMSLFQQTLNEIEGLGPSAKTQLFRGFIVLTAKAMLEMNADPASIKYFMDLYQNFDKLGTLAIALPQFSAHMHEADNAISRTDETSADQHSSAGGPNEVIASAFGKLLELVFTKENRASVFKNIQEQAEDLIRDLPPAVLSQFMGTSHPALILRINNILKMDSYPAVYFANPFLKLFVLESAVRQALGEHTELEEAYAERFEDDQLDMFPAGDQSSAAQSLQLLHNELVKDIIDSVVRLGLAAKYNPRFSNLIENYAFLRETELISLQLLNEQLKGKVTSQDTQNKLKDQIARITQTLSHPNEVLEALQKALQKQITQIEASDAKDARLETLNVRLTAIKTLLTTTDSEELDKLRELFVPERLAGTIARRRHIPKQDANDIKNFANLSKLKCYEYLR